MLKNMQQMTLHRAAKPTSSSQCYVAHTPSFQSATQTGFLSILIEWIILPNLKHIGQAGLTKIVQTLQIYPPILLTTNLQLLNRCSPINMTQIQSFPTIF